MRDIVWTAVSCVVLVIFALVFGIYGTVLSEQWPIALAKIFSVCAVAMGVLSWREPS